MAPGTVVFVTIFDVPTTTGVLDTLLHAAPGAEDAAEYRLYPVQLVPQDTTRLGPTLDAVMVGASRMCIKCHLQFGSEFWKNEGATSTQDSE